MRDTPKVVGQNLSHDYTYVCKVNVKHTLSCTPAFVFSFQFQGVYKPEQEEQETIRSKDTKFADVSCSCELGAPYA